MKGLSPEEVSVLALTESSARDVTDDERATVLALVASGRLMLGPHPDGVSLLVSLTDTGREALRIARSMRSVLQ